MQRQMGQVGHWNTSIRISDERVGEVIRLVLREFGQLGSTCWVPLSTKQANAKLPVLRPWLAAASKWQAHAYHTVLQILQHLAGPTSNW
jgi:hypothetical protein